MTTNYDGTPTTITWHRPGRADRFMEIYRATTPWWKRLLYKLLPPFCFGPFGPGIKHSLKILWRNLVRHPREFLVTGVAPPVHKNHAAFDEYKNPCDWSRAVNSTIKTFIRESETNVLRNRKLTALLKEKDTAERFPASCETPRETRDAVTLQVFGIELNDA